jgi:uncharacterized protein YaaQ
MKMIIAVLKDEDADHATQALTAAGFRVTRVASTGGFFRRGSSTLLIGVEDDKVDSALQLMRENTAPATDEKHGVAFVVNVARFEQL